MPPTPRHARIALRTMSVFLAAGAIYLVGGMIFQIATRSGKPSDWVLVFLVFFGSICAALAFWTLRVARDVWRREDPLSAQRVCLLISILVFMTIGGCISEIATMAGAALPNGPSGIEGVIAFPVSAAVYYTLLSWLVASGLFNDSREPLPNLRPSRLACGLFALIISSSAEQSLREIFAVGGSETRAVSTERYSLAILVAMITGYVCYRMLIRVFGADDVPAMKGA